MEPITVLESPAPCRTLWTCDVVTSEYGRTEERRQVTRLQDALLIASLTEHGHHAPALDIDLPIEASPRAGAITRLRFPGLTPRPRPWKKMIAQLAEMCFVSTHFAEDQSRWTDGVATWQIELIVPARVVPSSTPGHGHLYIDAEVHADAYWALCKKMQKAGLLESGYVHMSKLRGMTMLLKPGLSKAELIAAGRMLER